MPNMALGGSILCGILLGVAIADDTCSTMEGCPQASNDDLILLQSFQSRVRASSEIVEEEGDTLLGFEHVANKEESKLRCLR